MTHLSSVFRDPEAVQRIAGAIARATTRSWTVMEVCGGQTHSIVKHGLEQLLPGSIEILHGPGCPVCVTPLELIDKARILSKRSGVTLCSFGDMLRVPGTDGDLISARAEGADVRVVYSPLDAVALARRIPDRQIVFFAVGFETTSPAHAMAVKVAARENLGNFSILSSQVLVPPSLMAILESPDSRVQGFLGPGHVSTVMGTSQYDGLARRFGVPIVITGFEPVDILAGVLALVKMLERGESGVEIAYARAVEPAGNRAAQETVFEIFEVCDRSWRGIGLLPRSGLKLRPEFARYDAESRFEISTDSRESELCKSGSVLRGLLRPVDCPAFGKACTPETPLGATMVSSEGACAAYYRYRMLASATTDRVEGRP